MLARPRRRFVIELDGGNVVEMKRRPLFGSGLPLGALRHAEQIAILGGAFLAEARLSLGRQRQTEDKQSAQANSSYETPATFCPIGRLDARCI